jgi:hypothetical protein
LFFLDAIPYLLELCAVKFSKKASTPKKGAACSLLITCGVWVIECLHFARIRAGLPHIPAKDVSKGFNKRLWILSA